MFTKSEATARLRELSEIITKSREAYFNLNQSDITDQEYDQNISEVTKIIAKYPELEDDFKILNRVGVTPNSKFKKVKHLTPMYSLSNGFDSEDIFLDIGANIGVICIPAVSRGLVEEAIAIEPESENFKLLKLNISLNNLLI